MLMYSLVVPMRYSWVAVLELRKLAVSRYDHLSQYLQSDGVMVADHVIVLADGAQRHVVVDRPTQVRLTL